MFKRFAVLFFILVVAGQAWAGICGCLNTQAQPSHSCCKRSKKSSVTTVASKGCCDQDCSWSAGQRTPLSQSENSAVDVSSKVKAQPLTRIVWSLPILAVEQPVQAAPYLNHRLRYSRPPDLYLRHHSFLI
jgi:hypothetical protein